MNVVVIIHAYNEERTVGEVVDGVLTVSFPFLAHGERVVGDRVRVIVVDDGSRDRTAQVATAAGAQIVSHPINRGLGAALSTGITAALRLGADIVVTLDADGQHDPSEIPTMIAPIMKGEADAVVGSRFIRGVSSRPERSGVERSLMVNGKRSLDYARDDRAGIPFTRKVANFAGNLITWFLFGIWVSDSQSGFRAFSRAAAQKLHLRTSTMEVSSEIIKEIARNKLRLQEVPITVRYTEYSLSKGQGFFRGLETLWKLIVLKFFR